ncbi:MAG: nucleoside kinase [Muribaculaceae bacterium]|nr:nucleoside kinase [Muribaculaceae bacterium]
MQLYCLNIKEYIGVPGGITLSQIASILGDRLPFRPVCATVNNKAEALSFPLYAPKQIEFADARSPLGRRAVVRSLCMMLYRAVATCLPGLTLRMEHSVSRGYYCRLFTSDDTPRNVSPDEVAMIREEMCALAERELPFERHEKLTSDVIEIFKAQHLDSKVLLLETTGELYTTYYTLDGLADSYYGPLVPDTGCLRVFGLESFREGMLLLPPSAEDPQAAAVPCEQPRLFKAFTDYLNFNRVIKVSTVGELNRVVQRRETAELINVAEAMHDKLLGRISDEIAARYRQGGARVITLAGPSSSGKTTTTKRLAIQLMTNLMTPRMISLDDYFVDREKTPLDSTGDYDYEHLHALDLDRLHSDLRRLLAGETINLPTYSFELGRRIDRERPLRLDPGEVLLIEGIHGLNPELTAGLNTDEVYKVYVSALTTLAIDDHNWISTTDSRLLRRIVRDHKYRHTSALSTLRRWGSVRRGEERWIFPYQENADATFNSSLIFEMGVMKDYAEPLLRQVPHDDPQYAEAYRLLRLLEYFTPIPADQIPSTSLLREFLGGSSFRY